MDENTELQFEASIRVILHFGLEIILDLLKVFGIAAGAVCVCWLIYKTFQFGSSLHRRRQTKSVHVS